MGVISTMSFQGIKMNRNPDGTFAPGIVGAPPKLTITIEGKEILLKKIESLRQSLTAITSCCGLSGQGREDAPKPSVADFAGMYQIQSVEDALAMRVAAWRGTTRGQFPGYHTGYVLCSASKQGTLSQHMIDAGFTKVAEFNNPAHPVYGAGTLITVWGATSIKA